MSAASATLGSVDRIALFRNAHRVQMSLKAMVLSRAATVPVVVSVIIPLAYVNALLGTTVHVANTKPSLVNRRHVNASLGTKVHDLCCASDGEPLVFAAGEWQVNEYIHMRLYRTGVTAAHL